MSTIFGLIGSGGYGREVMPIIKENITQNDKVFFIIEGELEQQEINDVLQISLSEFNNILGPKKFNISIADSKVRERIALNCLNLGIDAFSIFAKNSVILDKNIIGVGAIISPFVTITSNVKIGSFFHANIYSYIAHDCIIGDYVTFAPGVKCNGNVKIGNRAYIGAGAILKQGTRTKPLIIGEGAVVGMGAVVFKDVLPYTTVFGNPARILQIK